MTVLKSFAIAMSFYSKIPMPQFEWKKEDMRYVLCFFPVVGAVIAVLYLLWFRFCAAFSVGETARTLVSCAIPLLVTGGFHVDGFMDTADALHSYAPREKKLEILKDSHIGAFAVIRFALYAALFAAACAEIPTFRAAAVFALGFCLSRALSGISVLQFPKAKKDGNVAETAGSADKGRSTAVLAAETAAIVAGMIAADIFVGLLTAAAAGLTLWYYAWRSKKEFGGVTGDTSGYFVLICELAMAMSAAIFGHIFGGGFL